MEVMQAERRLIPGGRLPVTSAWFAAGVGSTLRSTCVLRLGSTATPTPGTAVSASALSAPEFEPSDLWSRTKGSTVRAVCSGEMHRAEATGRSVEPSDRRSAVLGGGIEQEQTGG